METSRCALQSQAEQESGRKRLFAVLEGDCSQKVFSSLQAQSGLLSGRPNALKELEAAKHAHQNSDESPIASDPALVQDVSMSPVTNVRKQQNIILEKQSLIVQLSDSMKLVSDARKKLNRKASSAGVKKLDLDLKDMGLPETLAGMSAAVVDINALTAELKTCSTTQFTASQKEARAALVAKELEITRMNEAMEAKKQALLVAEQRLLQER